MDDSERQKADQRFEEALERTGARDPREFYRQALRELRESDPKGYERAVKHFEEVLIPSIAHGEAEPLRAWREYGRLVAEITAPGRTVALDHTGRSHTYDPDVPLDHLVLHLPDRKGARAILVALPPEPTPAQRATYTLLVTGKQRLQESN